MRRAARRDENESLIVAYLQANGYSVERLSAKGVPDLLVGKRGRNWLLEVIGFGKASNYPKTGGLTPDQVDWHGSWRGQVAVVTTIEEAVRVCAG